MIKVKVNNEYKDVVKIFGGGTLQKEIIKVWSREAQEYVYESSVEYTGALPITINANGDALIDYLIYGNTVQNGTPTPENPIMPDGVGEPTESGEPAGYKLPMTVSDGNTVRTVPIYLGEARTTRKIKKLVLTGEENWQRQMDSHTKCINLYTVSPSAKPNSTIISNVVTYSNSAGSGNDFVVNVGRINGFGTYLLIDLALSDFATVNEWKTYLQQQYANGTPVTIWYVLAEPETAVVNEPLMKIGDYADTLNMEQADANIPTFAGTTVIDYDGKPKPSQMYIKYRR